MPRARDATRQAVGGGSNPQHRASGDCGAPTPALSRVSPMSARRPPAQPAPCPASLRRPNAFMKSKGCLKSKAPCRARKPGPKRALVARSGSPARAAARHCTTSCSTLPGQARRWASASAAAPEGRASGRDQQVTQHAKTAPGGGGGRAPAVPRPPGWRVWHLEVKGLLEVEALVLGLHVVQLQLLDFNGLNVQLNLGDLGGWAGGRRAAWGWAAGLRACGVGLALRASSS